MSAPRDNPAWTFSSGSITCECQAFKDAQLSGTDNEAWGRLIRRDGAEGWSIGIDLPPMKFCPWCGREVPQPTVNVIAGEDGK